MTKTLTLDDAFEHLVDRIATKRVTDDDVADTKQKVLQWVADEVVGKPQHCPYSHCESHTCRHWEELRDKQRQILKDHGWKPKEE